MDFKIQLHGNYLLFGTSNENKKIIDVRKRVGAIVETPSIYLSFTARENMIEQFKLVGNPNFDEIDELLKLVNLENTGKKKVKNFSLGMKQRLGIAMTLASHPDFIILDEPINGLDPEGIIDIRELVLKLNKETGITFLISSHYLDELSRITTHYGFLDNGIIIKEISGTELAKKLEHRIELKVDKPQGFIKFFEDNDISYEVIDDKTINIYGNQNLTKLITKASKENLIIEDAHEFEETLENYYMNLIGGDKND